MRLDRLKKLVIDALEDLKAQDIKVLDVRGLSNVTDLMIVASGTSDRQVKAIAYHVVEKAKKKGLPPLGVEGEQAGEWALVDLGDAVVHIMLPQTRDFYNLEKLWGDAAIEEGAGSVKKEIPKKSAKSAAKSGVTKPKKFASAKTTGKRRAPAVKRARSTGT
ncbi:MAG: ribosome silencing factor [Gammaproteobacteria bacterium]|nr:ribosome silencing factor [Gammaproteobacteria bacterium]